MNILTKRGHSRRHCRYHSALHCRPAFIRVPETRAETFNVLRNFFPGYSEALALKGANVGIYLDNGL